MEKEPRIISSFMGVEDFEAAIAASVEKDSNGRPIPNYSVVKGACSIQHEDGTWEFKKPQENQSPNFNFMNQFLEELVNRGNTKIDITDHQNPQ